MKWPMGLNVMAESGGSSRRQMTQSSVIVKPIEIALLKALLDEPTAVEGGSADVLVIDCRSFLSYNNGHIWTAHNVYYPPILRRRYDGRNIPVENILRCSRSRQGLLDGRYGTVVVYDDSTYAADGLIVDDDYDSLRSQIHSSSSHDNLILVLQSLACMLSSHVADRSLRFLNGGFAQFSETYKHLIKTEFLQKTNPMSMSSCDVFDSASFNKGNLTHSGSNCNKTMSNAQKLFCHVADQSENPSQATASVDTIKCHSSNDRGDPIEILPWLYLGNAYHASQEASLSRIGIFALLNVAEMKDSDNSVLPASSPDFCHMNLPIADNSTSDIRCNFPQAIEFIENVRLSGGKVLVHCLAGISRSPTICIAYLMYTKNISLDQAHDFLKSKRNLISPNLNFMRQLAEYERILSSGCQSSGGGGILCSERSLVCYAAPNDENTKQSSSACSVLSRNGPSPNTALISQSLCVGKAKSSQMSEKKNLSGCVAVAVTVGQNSRKRPRPDSLSFSVSCNGKSLKSVPMTPCTKQAIFTFDFPSVGVLASSPTVSHSPLLSPS